MFRKKPETQVAFLAKRILLLEDRLDRLELLSRTDEVDEVVYSQGFPKFSLNNGVVRKEWKCGCVTWTDGRSDNSGHRWDEQR